MYVSDKSASIRNENAQGGRTYPERIVVAQKRDPLSDPTFQQMTDERNEEMKQIIQEVLENPMRKLIKMPVIEQNNSVRVDLENKFRDFAVEVLEKALPNMTSRDNKLRAEACSQIMGVTCQFPEIVPEEVVPMLVHNLTNNETANIDYLYFRSIQEQLPAYVFAQDALVNLGERSLPHLREALIGKNKALRERAFEVLYKILYDGPEGIRTKTPAPEIKGDPIAIAATKLFDAYKMMPIEPRYVQLDALGVIKGRDMMNMNVYYTWFGKNIDNLPEENQKAARLFRNLVDPTGITAPLLNGNNGQTDQGMFSNAVRGLNDDELKVVTEVLYEASKGSSLQLDAYLGKLTHNINRANAGDDEKALLKVTDELWTRYFIGMAKDPMAEARDFVSELTASYMADPGSIDLERVKNAVPEDRRALVKTEITALREAGDGSSKAENKVFETLFFLE